MTTGQPRHIPTLQERCEGGSPSACETWGQQLMVDNRVEEADHAYGLACATGSTSACVTQGKLRLEHGDVTGAEPPLRKAYDDDTEEGALALADLEDARGDAEAASRLRWEALAIDKSTVEFGLGWRVPWSGGFGMSMDLNVQPMGLKARRLVLGLNLGLEHELVSLNATVGYQHFVTNWFAPYGRALVGPTLSGARGSTVNLGVEAGVKVFGGPLGHLGVALGGSLDGASYIVFELGMDWVLALMVAAHM
ncbi:MULTISPECIES: hypothetical protein [Corallococcus]|uniref:hypothetical protein n=1 Tax=Corallococcus TaxID=83461 RepID=UPI00117D2227|nr:MULTISPECIES: hypothetical protein [Corallococcus]NBD14074.1 hypothetical protein [Corallococcus silvisoli]TSC22611.1 hypothetical protein FOF48_33440 [Corallococcus sp. Z5C101001]